MKSTDVCLALIELEQAEAVLVGLPRSASWYCILFNAGSLCACSHQRMSHGMQEHLTSAYENKTPKVVVSAVDIVTEALRYAGARSSSCHHFGTVTCQTILLLLPLPDCCNLLCREFGPKVLAPNSIIRDLPKLFEAKQVPIRDSVKKLAVSHTLRQRASSPHSVTFLTQPASRMH